MTVRYKAGAVALAMACALGQSAQAATVFSTDFEAGIPAGLAVGVAATTGVQGFAGLGATGLTFSGQMLRVPTGNLVTLTLAGLPAHTELSLGFLMAAIDSLDGTGTFPQGDFLSITLDGALVFRESFANAADYQVQSYVAPAGGELARKVSLGFTGPASGPFYTDSAYDFFLEPRLQGLAHTASTATLTFLMEGPGVQDLDDESWGMDHLQVSVTPVPEPSSVALAAVGALCMGVAGWRRRRGQGV
ncbi:PEP-CTERM sorting domain-containing protein [Aquabacterium lacunae]|uniref:PEP-CTERM sorting domain-containing protein n=1 Tax=Aquabacterium lacunae TaxID=2528630 RepID=A0A4Q9H402_9BURK|nr:PEP-CTERM sorting domain-containing protein [Aquabacterium lacunae]TBO30081.1 PEP-CTERM sorting domain-containing protein [Aquabacterium lacunae]